MKIVHAYKIYRPDVNGGIPAVMAMLSEDRTPGVTNEIVTARRFGWFRKYSVDGVPVTATTSFGSLFSLPLAPTFPLHVLRQAKTADFLIHHAPFPLNDLAIAIGLRTSTSLIVYWHAEIVGRSFLRMLLSPLIRRALRRADTILVSDERIALNSKFIARHKDKVAVVPYGVDTSYWAQVTSPQQSAVEEIRSRFPRLIVAIGRLVPYKGYEVLLQAMRNIDAHAIIIGDGPLLSKLQEMAKAFGISDRVTFGRGFGRDEVKTHLHAARLLVMPSVSIAEAFGIVQIEAMAAGLPVVNTDLPTAVPGIARHGLEGLTVPPRDPVALADAISRLLDDTDYAEQLGAAARARAIAEYDAAKFLERMSAVYQANRRGRDSATSA